MAAHTYWRIYITQTLTAGSYVALQEVQMFDASGTLLSTGGTATASSYFSSDPTYAPSKAFDNTDTTFWHSNVQPATTPQWLQYQLASAGDVAVVFISPRGGSFITQQSPTNFKIQYSDDGSSWTDAATYTGVTWSTAWFYTSFPVPTPAAGAYTNWRVYILSTQNGQPPSGAEFQLRETAGGSNLASSTTWHTSWTDSFGAGNEGYRIFDGNASTMWAAQNTPPGNQVGNALQKAAAIVEVVWTARNDSSYAQSPSSFKLQASNDGTTWTDIATITPATWTSAGQSQTLAVVAAGGAGVLHHPGMEGMRPVMLGGLNG